MARFDEEIRQLTQASEDYSAGSVKDDETRESHWTREEPLLDYDGMME